MTETPEDTQDEQHLTGEVEPEVLSSEVTFPSPEAAPAAAAPSVAEAESEARPEGPGAEVAPAGDEEGASGPLPDGGIEKVAFVWDDRLWREGFGPGHPLRPKRLLRFYRLFEASGALYWRETRVVAPDGLDPAVLAEYHSPEYVETVRALSEGATELLASKEYGLDPQETPITLGFWLAHTLHVAAALTAARLVAEGSVPRAFTPAGGFHHAQPAQARAGHVFNDVVLAIRRLLGAGLKVAYLDLDATHGDAVARAFYASDRVLTVSLHEGPQFLFPGTGWAEEIGEGEGRGYTVNLPLPPATHDEPYLWAFEEVVPPLLARFQPDVVITQTGLGAHYADELSRLRLTTGGFTRLWRRIRQLCPRWVALGGGGLNLDVAARGWLLAYAVIAGREPALPRRLPRRYAERWGAGEIHDEPLPPLSGALDEYVWSSIRRQVVTLQRMLFPLHGLEPPPVATGAALAPLEPPVPVVAAHPTRVVTSLSPVALPPRPARSEPMEPILPEPEEVEEDDELQEFEEFDGPPAPAEPPHEIRRRRKRGGRRARQASKARGEATLPASRGAAGRAGERQGPAPDRRGEDRAAGTGASAPEAGKDKSRRRRRGRRGRGGKKTESPPDSL